MEENKSDSTSKFNYQDYDYHHKETKEKSHKNIDDKKDDKNNKSGEDEIANHNDILEEVNVDIEEINEDQKEEVDGN